MKKSISKIYNMLIVVEDYLVTNNVIVLTIMGLKTVVGFLTGNVKRLKKMNQDLSEQPDQPALPKLTIEAQLDKLLMFNSKKHVAYAVIQGDLELEKKVTIKKSELTRLDDKSKLAKATTLYESNETNLTALAPHGLTADTQTALKAKIDAFENAIPKRRETTTSGSTSLEDFESLVKETNAFLVTKLDKIVDGADEDKSEFVTTYFKNREHVDLPSSTIAFKGRVVDEAGLPIMGVVITNGKTKFQTTKLGNFRLAHKEAGIFKFLFEKPGFKSKLVDITIGVAGERTTVVVILEKI